MAENDRYIIRKRIVEMFNSVPLLLFVTNYDHDKS